MQSVNIQCRRVPLKILWALLGLSLAGCGATHTAASSQPQATLLLIYQQPQSAYTPLNQTATFSVEISAVPNPVYQWNQNGVAIPGANSATYTTPPVSLGENNSVFTVTIQALGQTVTSQPATLAVGPRSPAPGDLRFQQVAAPTTASTTYPNFLAGTVLIYPAGWTYQGVTGSPLRMGAGQCGPNIPQDCWWAYGLWTQPKPSSYSMAYVPDVPANLVSELNKYSTSSSVVTSLDIETPEQIFGFSAITNSTQTGFDYRLENASAAALPGAIAADGADGRVVTAISFDESLGGYRFLSYGWTADTHTQYETQVTLTNYDGIGPAATALAQAGYIITAFQGNHTDGFVLVGTRVKGDSYPRPVLISPAVSVPLAGYAVVGWAISEQASVPPIWIFEK